MQAGQISHEHIGSLVTFEQTVAFEQPWQEQPVTQTETVTGAVVRVQHNAGETLLALTSWTGALAPEHPITVETGA